AAPVGGRRGGGDRGAAGQLGEGVLQVADVAVDGGLAVVAGRLAFVGRRLARVLGLGRRLGTGLLALVAGDEQGEGEGGDQPVGAGHDDCSVSRGVGQGAASSSQRDWPATSRVTTPCPSSAGGGVAERQTTSCPASPS